MNINKRDLSSSEDEICTDILKEVIDQQFLYNDLYSTEKAQVIASSKKAQINKLDKNSLTIKSKEEDEFTNFGVTTAFQSFIAKKLDEILERTIELENNETANCYGEQKRKKSKSSGIKLLNTSKKLLNVREDCTEHDKKSKRNRQVIKDDENGLIKFQEASVESEHILSKLDTKAWVNKRPEPEFKYKRLKNGVLVEI